MNVSRRQFGWTVGAIAAMAACRKGYAQSEGGLSLGLNTYSLRALSQEEAVPIVIGVMKETGLRDCQLLSSHVEPAKFSPGYPAGGGNGPRVPPTPEQLEQRKAMAAALAEWRLDAPMSYFEEVRSRFEKQGLRIKAYSARPGSSEAEIDRVFLMGKALGADSLIMRLTEPLTAMVAAAADKHRMTVGLQFTDVSALDEQLAASKYFRIDPDIGDLTKAKMDALAFVQARYQSISSLDLKDAIPGGASVPFGEGQSQMKEVLDFLRQKNVPLTVYVDCDYAGTGRSTDEVKRCVSYLRKVMG